ncbi:hypothetical protein [uncultured Kordia sp.]|uniref:hypothetical protein n=1 Tax=uncultured Kordia sp. TaxID=507699 RepID=UPI002615E45C|nr:hypothetical protein [uncultured Kordia sp.]
MKNFELFVDETVTKWRLKKKYILENQGLAGVSNRESGDSAENYILRKIGGLPQNYIGKKSKGSQSPADIFAVARRGRFWHIMLIQVKSSENKNNIYTLNEEDKKVLNEFAKFFKKELRASKTMSNYKNSAVIISAGYAGVFNDLKNRKHFLKDTKHFKSFKKNMPDINSIKLNLKIALAHSLATS